MKKSGTEIKIRCKGNRNIGYDRLKHFQGHLKEMSKPSALKLKESILRYGWIAPVFVWNGNEILDGHGRLLVLGEMIKEGYTIGDIPVVDIEAKDKQEAAKILLSLNSHYQAITEEGLYEFMHDFELKMEDLDICQLADIDLERFEAGYFTDETEEGKVPEPPANPKVKAEELWLLDKHRLLCGDSTKQEDAERLMGGRKAELLFTSPPYSDMRDYGGGQDLSIETLINFIPIFWPYVKYQVINLGIQRKDNEVVPYWDAYIQKAKDCGYKFLSWNVWNREGAGFSVAQITAMFAIQHEWIFVFGKDRKAINLTVPNKEGGTFNDHSSNRQRDGTVKKSKAMVIRSHRQLGTVISIINEKSREFTKDHPAIFPVALAEVYVEAMTSQPDKVIDPFLGSGSTLIACEKIGRICCGMEISPEYCDVILDRWSNLTNKDPIREDGKKWSEVKNGRTKTTAYTAKDSQR